MFCICSQQGVRMTEPAERAQDTLKRTLKDSLRDTLEADVDAAIALCDGDVRAALRAALVYNDFLDRKLETMRALVSSGYTRGKISPCRAGSQKLDDWRDISRGDHDSEGSER
jgi:hypothetical protein